MSPISVLVVDDQADLRLLMRTLIFAANDGLECRLEAASGEEALSCLDEGTVTVIVLDQMMPGMTGTETAQAILTRDPDQRIILFSAFLDERLRSEARSLGIRECVDKANFSDLVPAVRRAAA
ncbi:MAG: response regulator transcription factor [Acidimicrobiales bacterium]